MKKMSGWYLWCWEGAVKGESFLHPGKPLHQWEDWPGQKKSLRGEYRNWFTEPDWRENCTDGQRALLHSLAWDSCPLVQTSSGHWDSGFGDPTQGEDWDWMDRSSKVGLESGVIATEGVHGEGKVVYQVRCHCLGRGCMKGGGWDLPL